MTYFSFTDSFFLSVELLYIFGVFCLFFFFMLSKIESFFYLYGRFLDYLNKNTGNFALFFLTVIFINCLFLFEKRHFNFFFFFFVDDFILLVKIFILLISFFIFFSMNFYFFFEQVFRTIEYYFCLLLSILSMFLVISSSDLVALYLSIEMQSLSLYILASSKQNSILSIEAGLKYFVLGTVSSGLLLIGSSLFYGYSGITRFFEFSIFFQNLNIEIFSSIFFSLIFILIAFLFKFGAAPFHIWTPDVYEGSPTITTFFFALVPKLVLFGLLIRLSFDIFISFESNWKIFLFYSAIFSLVLGSIGGIFQYKIKRLLAYSSIANVGFLLCGLINESLEGFVASFIYFFIYAIVSISLFFLIISTRYFNNFLKLKNIFEYAGLLNINSFLVIFFVLNLFSLIGIPPLAGFFSKLFIFFSLVSSDAITLLLVSMLCSALSGYFYLRIIRILLFKRYIGFFFLLPINEKVALVYVVLLFFNLLFAIDLFYFFKLIYSFFLASFMGVSVSFII